METSAGLLAGCQQAEDGITRKSGPNVSFSQKRSFDKSDISEIERPLSARSRRCRLVEENFRSRLKFHSVNISNFRALTGGSWAIIVGVTEPIVTHLYY